ncbi:alpha-tocopherol transfer protein-like [Euwallacea fornicatus]|uniref:alpha-tocopherol transfer protein-like n=1 Tax=Euwallacea fornicatus TaxID=995702 RepID=UPI00338DD1FE
MEDGSNSREILLEIQGEAVKPDEALRPSIDVSEPGPHDPLMKWAERNIGEDRNTKLELIEELRSMIFERGECVPDRTDDVFLLRFLRARHFIVRMAHRLIVNYHAFREENPNYFGNVDFKTMLDIAEAEIFSVPPYVNEDGRRMLFFRIGKWNTSRFTTEALFQAVIFLIQTAILEPKHQILGGVCVMDVGDLGANHAWYLSPSIVKHMLAVAYSSIPHRIEAVHIINVSKIFDCAFGMLKPFLSDYVKAKIVIHPDLESLHKHVSPKYLPERYGGIHKDYRFDEWIAVLNENEGLLDEMGACGYEGGREFLKNLRL